MLKYLIVTSIIIGILVYANILTINTNKLKSISQSGVNKVTSVTKNAVNDMVDTAKNSKFKVN